jgi:hypothetical protein
MAALMCLELASRRHLLRNRRCAGVSRSAAGGAVEPTTSIMARAVPDIP